MSKQALLWSYIRRVFRYWWVVVVEVILVVTDFVERFFGTWYLFPLWAKVAIGSAVLVVAQYLAYQELAVSKDAVQAELDEARRKASERKPELAIHPEARSAFYVHIESQHRTLGTYLELWLTVQNDGEVNSIIRSFDLYIEETGQSIENASPSPRQYVLTLRANHAVRTDWIARDGTILVESHNYKTGILPLYTDAVIADDVQSLHCRLTIHDTEGTSASANFLLGRVG